MRRTMMLGTPDVEWWSKTILRKPSALMSDASLEGFYFIERIDLYLNGLDLILIYGTVDT